MNSPVTGRRVQALLVTLTLLVTGASAAWAARPEDPGRSAGQRPDRVPGEVLARFASAARTQALASTLAAVATDVGPAGRSGIRRIRLHPAMTVDDALAYLRGLTGVVTAQPNYVYHLAAIPNDPEFGEQWAARNTGQTVTGANYPTNNPGTPGADMALTRAWDVRTDCRGVVVAVIDSGVDHVHGDLAPSMWNGGAAFPNHGWDFADGDNDPTPVMLTPEDDHGTHVAATIGAVGDNATGTAGVCWNAEIMAIRAGSFLAGLTTADVIDSIDFAVDNGADVINMSLGGELPFDPLFGAAIGRARAAGILVVATAGNGGADGIGDDLDGGGDDGDPTTNFYPCAFTHDNVVCVSASDQAHEPGSFANGGTTSVDIAAPGTNVLSASVADGLDLKSGTSMATAHATGVATLLWSQNPAYDFATVRAALLASGTAVASWGGRTATGRVVSGDRAVRHIRPPTGIAISVTTP